MEVIKNKYGGKGCRFNRVSDVPRGLFSDENAIKLIHFKFNGFLTKGNLYATSNPTLLKIIFQVSNHNIRRAYWF